MKSLILIIMSLGLLSTCEKPAPQNPKIIYTGKEQIKQTSPMDTIIKAVANDSIKVDSLVMDNASE